jgi:hypothetical protein
MSRIGASWSLQIGAMTIKHLAFLVAIVVASPAGRALAQGAGAPEAPRIVAHEWGVWKIRAGLVAHLEELAAETPAFVFRSPMLPPARPVYMAPPFVPIPQVAPRPLGPVPDAFAPPRPPARKPVLFLTSNRAVDVSVEVGFRGGEPWLFYPAATVEGAEGGSRLLTWRGRLAPSARAALPAVPPGHWWQLLRDAGGDLFLGADGTAERFLFYDGPVQFEPSFVIERRPGGALVQPMTLEEALFFADGAGYTENRVARQPRGAAVVAQGDGAALRARLDGELRARGLTAAEARSLLETWRDDLFLSAAPRAIYFVPRNLYDLMLPLRVTPAPAETVRVGLVIEEL